MTTRTVVVVNPASQNGALGRKWPDVARVLRRAIDGFEPVFTKGPGDATELTAQALDGGAECIVSVGGDGTTNEVVNGFFRDGQPRAKEACLGVIPFGTGGDFRRTVAIPNNVEGAADIIAARRRRRMDVGLIEYEYRTGQGRDGERGTRVFINIASFGISGLVDRMVNESSKRFGGRVSFMVGTLRAAWQYDNQRVHLAFDDDPADSLDMTINTVAVANGRYFGGGMMMAPEAEPDDGYFDVVAIGDVSRSRMLLSGRRIYAGTHLSMEHVSHRRARVVRAEPMGTQDVELDVDGETPGRLPASFRILPAAIDLLAAPRRGA